MNDLDKLIRELEGRDYYEPHEAREPRPMWIAALWFGAALTGIAALYGAGYALWLAVGA